MNHNSRDHEKVGVDHEILLLVQLLLVQWIYNTVNIKLYNVDV